MKNFIFVSLLTLLLTACASSTDSGAIGADRRQLLLVPESEILSQSEQAYEQTKKQAQQKNALDQNALYFERVNRVAQRLIPQTQVFRKEAPSWKWEVHVITSPEVNAYCMPGGKIMFYSSIIEKLNMTDGEIAAVMGHEISHALREHGRERMSEELIKQIGIEGLIMTGKLDEKYAGVAAQFTSIAVSLPHSRGQESEADEMGVELMARAGYNPREAVSLWKKMANLGGGKPPEILSTHPADSTRIKNIESLLPKVLPLYHGG